jgi:hypothetical protein
VTPLAFAALLMLGMSTTPAAMAQQAAVEGQVRSGFEEVPR